MAPSPAYTVDDTSPCLAAAFVKEAAAKVGFDACGIAVAEPIDEAEFGLAAWLEAGRNAAMGYMAAHAETRHDPRRLVEGAKSVVSLLVGYKPSERVPNIAQYAYGEDYHELMKRMLYQLIALIQERYPDFEARPFVDTAPISDKLWAAKAGLGWIGRNTLLVNPVLGSYCFVGELVTTASFDSYDAPMADGCGECRLCVEACPNHALQPAAQGCSVNANACASYHTIENRAEELPSAIRLSGFVYGCDCCQLVCPYNRTAAVRYQLTPERLRQLENLTEAEEAEFKHFVRHSAMNRIKYPQWQRNVNKVKS